MKVRTDLRAGFGAGGPEVTGEHIPVSAILEMIAPLPPAAPVEAAPAPEENAIILSPDVRRRTSNLLPFALGWLRARLQEAVEWLRSRAARRPEVEVIDPRRWWEIDAFRGVAIGMMLVMHLSISWLAVFSQPASAVMMYLWPMMKFWVTLPIAVYTIYQAAFAMPAFDFSNKGNAALPLFLAEVIFLTWAVLWLCSAGSGATAFMFLMGLSMVISFQRAQQKPGGAHFGKWLSRGLLIFGMGLVITLLSFVFVPQKPILFGILHMLGLSTILAYPFLHLPAWITAASGAGVIASLPLLKEVTAPSLLLVWLRTPGLSMLDYFPMVPWFGAVLLGVAAGKFYVQARQSGKITPPDFSQTRLGKGLSWLGQRSLVVYMAQAPIFLAGMALL